MSDTSKIDEELTIDKIIQALPPDNDDFYVEHPEGSNSFTLKREDVLKESVKKMVRLRVWAHSIGEYWFILSRSGLTLHHETYGISQQDEDFLE